MEWSTGELGSSVEVTRGVVDTSAYRDMAC